MITLVVVAHNDIKMLEKFFIHHAPFVDEIVAADDGSTDGSADIIRKYAHKYIISTKPVYYCEWYWQRLVDMASNDWILWLDSDQFVEAGALARLQAMVKTQPYYDFTFRNDSFSECYMCFKKEFRQAKLLDRREISFTIFPHAGNTDKANNVIGGMGNSIGYIDHFMKDTTDPQEHIRHHIMKICRWYDCAKKALNDYKDPKYNLERLRCTAVYENAGIDITRLPWLCSKYNDRLEWLSDDELWEKIKGRDVFSFLKEIKADMEQSEKTKILKNILNSNGSK